ncbi:alkaline phosphatase D family protein [Aureibacter tunicatorum]|uniref:Alkaline phosphatase D n=1 Tax=Aureibacter tunicatorum TaxID=866807 RepID=A0AAE4BQK0_9BACT|nr:alkaline phosphatase D family protein [Aureibacter tunicatorum]MDR6239214.1 alkaline phosphatase D [Aureibacter tunicatorum]BDD04861.1 alkaline phosphatase [Aureibacter tunicatorum]
MKSQKLQTLLVLAMSLFISTQFAIAQNVQLLRNSQSRLNAANAISGGPFYHGVASGDPLSDRVIIWTRVTPDVDQEINVSWEVAIDQGFSQVVREGNFMTNADRDYTVKVDVDQLEPFQTYYYRFHANGITSPVGRTKTAPVDSDRVRVAVVSCSNYQQGFFNVYDHMSKRNDIDVILHLGDYIYEYEEGGYGYSDKLKRGHEPKHEIVSLKDYRVRYSFYRMDPGLQAVHQQYPFITTWDDHEFTNDAYKDGAENHQSNEGDWEVRKSNAKKAYFEWLPVREGITEGRIYRDINYGDLLDIIMIDTRVEGRQKQGSSRKKAKKYATEGLIKELASETNFDLELVLGNAAESMTEEEMDYIIESINKGLTGNLTFDSATYLQDSVWQKFISVITSGNASDIRSSQRANSSRTILGQEQYNWLTNKLSNSSAQWKLIGNQVLMMPVYALSLDDSWEGYEDERQNLLNHISGQSIENVVVATGDIHMTFAADVIKNKSSYTKSSGRGSVAVEFVTPSVTSANVDEFVNISDSFLGWLLRVFNPHIKKTNLHDHGFILIDFNNNRVQADWYYVNTVESQNYHVNYGFGYQSASGDNHLSSTSSASSRKSAAALAPDYGFEGAEIFALMGVYPNPTVSELNIHFAAVGGTSMNINVYDLLGNIVISKSIEDLEGGEYIYNLKDVSLLKTGSYILSLEQGNQRKTRKFIKQ